MSYPPPAPGGYPSPPPPGRHGITTGVMRWPTRGSAWSYGLIDKYPGFSWSP